MPSRVPVDAKSLSGLRTAPHAVQTVPSPDGVGWRSFVPRWILLLTVGAIAFALIVSRRPDAILNAQFYGEDGPVWYAQAYNQGAFRALFIPEAGYYVTDARLAALIAVHVPLILAPLLMNLLGILIQLLPVVFLFSARFDSLIPDFRARALLAFLYLALPNTSEIDASITNAQWHLAVLAFMVVIAALPSNWGWKAFDAAVLILSGLSGPYCIVLCPIIVLHWWQHRSRWTLVLLGADTLVAVVQGLTILRHLSSTRVHTPLGASLPTLVRLVSGQIYVALVAGANGYESLFRSHYWSSLRLPFLIFLVGTVILLFVAWRSPFEVKLFLLYAAVLFAAALVAPHASRSTPQWIVMARPGAANRYEFMPLLAIASALVWSACSRTYLWLRAAAAVLLLSVVLVAIPRDWQYSPTPDFHLARYAAEFDKVPPGTPFTIPITPPGWYMELVKHR